MFRRSDVQCELRGRVSCVIRRVSDLSVEEFICQCECESTMVLPNTACYQDKYSSIVNSEPHLQKFHDAQTNSSKST